MDSKPATEQDQDASTSSLHASLGAASAADNGVAHGSAGHSWSVLPAIVLIVVAVCWALLRQRRRQ